MKEGLNFCFYLAWSTYFRPKVWLLHIFGALLCGQYPCAGLEGMWFYEKGEGIVWTTPSCISVLKLGCCGARNAKGNRNRGRMETSCSPEGSFALCCVLKHLCILGTQNSERVKALNCCWICDMHAASCDESLWFFMIFWDVFSRITEVFISKKCNKLPSEAESYSECF